jgi:hypothetical protein
MANWLDDFIPAYKRDVTKLIELSDDWVYIYEPGKEIHEGYFYTIHGREFGVIAERNNIHINARVFLANWFRDGWHMEFNIPVGENPIFIAWEILKNTEMVWVATGRTYEAREELKQLGMRWHPMLKIWYSDELPECQSPNVYFRQIPSIILEKSEW